MNLRILYDLLYAQLIILFYLQGAPYNVTIDGDRVYYTDDTLELNCRADGIPELRYSWNGINSNASNITINNVNFDDEGFYTCTVSNLYGNASLTIEVIIIGKIQVYIQSKPVVYAHNYSIVGIMIVFIKI